MGERHTIRGIEATTHVDRHGERIAKEALEQMAQGDPQSDDVDWITWNHQTMLPPIGIVTRRWVEKRTDGEYQLAFEGQLLGSQDYVLLSRSSLQGLEVSQERLCRMVAAIEMSPLGHLDIVYDPRNFEDEAVELTVRELSELIDVRRAVYIRKATEAHSVIWIGVRFVGGLIAAGFLTRLGEMAADRLLEHARPFYVEMNNRLAQLLSKAKTGDRSDVIFTLPDAVPGVQIEGAVEGAEPSTLSRVWAKLPELHALATHFVQANPPDHFSQMKFLYNPASERWEVNYLTLRKYHSVILGPRYYVASHPLSRRWRDQQELMGSTEHKDE
jgi:hypothetical protein